ncbi:VanZ family protein [Sporolactobacillus nakayamae]|uniref:VanZ like family protein n=1 Tax=Sporolactobacillus nakayamae TaxID=269670 RepID=A0A1I2RL93_9BACL|nr:VanZ family protein [Sporolactobacillus nakayamae]SFG40239.1 VanZ like family protein [Sporolactobacillus nakayamae]
MKNYFEMKNIRVIGLFSVAIALFYLIVILTEGFYRYTIIEYLATLFNLIMFTLIFLFITRKIVIRGISQMLFFLAFQLYAWIAFLLLLGIDVQQLWFGLFDHQFERNFLSMINVIPFRTLITQFSGFPSVNIATHQIIGNIIVLAPFCFFLLYFGRITFKSAFLIIFLYSLSIEVLQFLSDLLFFQARAMDIDDVILNTAGVALGILAYVFYLGLAALCRRFVRKESPIKGNEAN